MLTLILVPLLEIEQLLFHCLHLVIFVWVFALGHACRIVYVFDTGREEWEELLPVVLLISVRLRQVIWLPSLILGEVWNQFLQNFKVIGLGAIVRDLLQLLSYDILKILGGAWRFAETHHVIIVVVLLPYDDVIDLPGFVWLPEVVVQLGINSACIARVYFHLPGGNALWELDVGDVKRLGVVGEVFSVFQEVIEEQVEVCKSDVLLLVIEHVILIN